ncbi:MAG: type II toxin-antitoxin system Phd/YefM family antitoxin, partial [Candidatus Rokuibacteriota bacterium]
MKKVGLRELKDRLAYYVREVRAGREIQVTDRGEVVAELLPPRAGAGRGASRRGLADLARRGLVSLGAPNDSKLYRR